MDAVRATGLDAAIFPAVAELEERGAQRPTLLLVSASGLGLLPTRLERAGRLPLSLLPEVPAAWSAALLHWGQLNGLPVWLLEDPHTPGEEALDQPAWARVWPAWLAAAAGAVSMIHTSGACALTGARLGSLGLVRDHLDFSGASPLVGLGDTRLGPMFPDTTRLHDDVLRRAALAECARLGLAGVEVVAACTPEPALETPAEQAWLRTAGADLSVQGLGPWLLAAAHAGLGTLAIGLVVAQGGQSIDIARVLAAARELSPALDDLLWAVAGAAPGQAQDDLEGDAP